MKKFESARDELVYLFEKNGNILLPEKVVEFAENENTHLHSKFEWDDLKAGKEYRLWQARQIISLELEIIKTDQSQKPTRMFVSLIDDRKKGGGYRLITDVMNDAEMREKLLHEALNELIRIKVKYGELNELKNVFNAIDKAQARGTKKKAA